MGIWFLGKRRPTSLEDAGNYKEEVTRPKAREVKHPNPKDVSGVQLSRPYRQTAKPKTEPRHQKGKK